MEKPSVSAADKEEVTLADLRDFPRLSYEQGDHNAFYFAEELQSTLPADKELIVTDRATLFNLLIGLGGYTISSGVINAELNGADIIARPLRVTDYMEVGVVQHGRVRASNYARRYIACLKRRLPSEAEDAADSI